MSSCVITCLLGHCLFIGYFRYDDCCLLLPTHHTAVIRDSTYPGALERVSYNLTAVSHPPATTGTTTRSNRLYKHCQLSKSRNCCQWNTVNKILINRPRPPSGRADEDLLLSLPLLRWKTVSGTAQDLDFGWLPRSLHLNFRAASWFDGVKERSAIPVSVFRFQSELNVSIDWVQMLVKCSLFFLRQAWLSST